ncbi:hypothetical protein DWQ65_02975 [Treponema phagedenis]|uniref:hypothetical protein n=1 Tax=Treponema phagedenis TaxID=162 RepID=UPI0001F63BF5|nr:hypothetical protein [Treponema phagedenis]EFW38159.1 hypothetical protein HMPREF9554_01347 [Treponema phagedenis F0421]QSH99057.1 hypothetical protein DWQ65_02975 [Treponema phagedenis]TYT79370.1 hypothetical protein FS559_09860 [Treponema phagedenis]
MALKDFLTINNLSIGEAARIAGVNRSTISRIASMDYPNWETKQTEIIEKLISEGCKAEGDTD